MKRLAILWCAALAVCAAGASWADDPTEEDSVAVMAPAPVAAPHRLEALVPDLAKAPFAVAPGVREFQNRLSVSPGWGNFGTGNLYTLRVAYDPNTWLGYEAGIGHNPGHSVHAVLHTFSAVFRHPMAGRFQPYVTAGYGMVIVFPGPSVNAAPVTKNTLAFGGGLEFYIRSDLALRGDLRSATVFGKQRDREGIVAYDYSQGTIGLAFYRTVGP